MNGYRSKHNGYHQAAFTPPYAQAVQRGARRTWPARNQGLWRISLAYADQKENTMNQGTMTQDTRQPTPKGPGSVSGAPHLPAGFTDTFTSHYIQAGDVRLHAVIGGDGPPLLLIHGWPENWYAWRLVMP